MIKKLSVLLVEDSEDDALLLLQELKRGGYEPEFERVDTLEAMNAALDRRSWDIVITDYSMPAFNGIDSLKLLREKGGDIPFILVSGRIGEEMAVEMMRAGARDYITKDSLLRLVPAIERELRDADIRREGKRIKKALQDSEERFRRIAEAVTDYIYSVRLKEGKPVQTTHSEACLAVTGYTKNEFAADPYLWFHMVHERDHDIVNHQIDQIISGHSPQSVEHRIIRKDGVMRWVESSIVPNTDVDGNLRSYDGIVRDITERKQAEAQVARKNKVLYTINRVFEETLTSEGEEELGSKCLKLAEELTDSSFGFLGELNKDGLFDTLAISNPGWDECRLPEEKATRVIKNMPVRGVDRATIRDEKSRIVNGEEAIAAHPDSVGVPEGHPRLTAYLGVPFKHEGKTIGLIGLANKNGGYTLEDQENIEALSRVIMEALRSKRAEEALHLSEEKFSKAFRSSPTFILISTLGQGRIIDVNDTFLDASGYSREEVINHTGQDLAIWANPSDHDKLVNGLREHGVVYNLETDMRIKNGEILSTLCSAELIEIKNEQCILAAMLDITERKKLENQLLHSQKMEAVGQLAGGVAHDFNNILSAIVNYVYMLHEKVKDDESMKNELDQITSLSMKGADITRGLLAFSRKHFINPIPLKLNDSVRTMEKLMTKFIGEDIHLNIKLTNKEPVIMADSAQIEQIIINLATNARDAMPDGGSLTIETDVTELDDNFIRAHGFGKPGTYALLTVMDTGIGMNEETRQKIFEPFYTTKEIGKGTGLGLAIIYGIVKQHDGYIIVYSEAGIGTTFKVYFQTVSGVVMKKEEMKVADVAGNAENVLVVEDEEAVRKSMKIILKRAGYKVMTAVDGKDAIEKFTRHRDKIDLLLLDVIMPKKNGREVYEELKKIRPGIKAIFTSGYSAEIVDKKGVLKDGLNYIAKPVIPRKLLLKIKEVLNGG